MKKISRLAVAAVLVGILVVVATGVWAAPVFLGTVPPPPDKGTGGGADGGGGGGGGGGCAVNIIKMGTASFTLGCKAAANVEKVGDPAAAPSGFVFAGDVFTLSPTPVGTKVKVCYAYPPELKDKEAKIYSLDEKANPKVWVEVPGAVVRGGQICVNAFAGVVALIGK